MSSSRTPSRVSSRQSRTPSRVEVALNGHFISPTTHHKGEVPIDPALLDMDMDVDPEQPPLVQPVNGVNGHEGPGSDEDAEGSDEDAEGEAVDEELDFQPWSIMPLPVEPAPSFYPPPQHFGEPMQNEAGPSRLPDLTAILHGHTSDRQSLSPDSILPAQSNKRGRPPRASTSASLSQPPSGAIPAQPHPNGTINGNGHSHPIAPLPSLKVKIKGNKSGSSKSKGKARASYDGNGVVVPDPYCSFCTGTAERNKQGRPESMVSCHLCGRSGHFSCLEMTSPELIRMVQSYNWTCIECKTCEECAAKENEDELMFCDGCDKGWHFACANPPLRRLPKGSWRCHHCRARISNSPSHAGPSSYPMPDPPPSQKYKGKGKGKGKSFEGYHPAQYLQTPIPLSQKPHKARKSAHPSDVFEESHSTTTPKIKPPRRPKIKNGTNFSPTPDLIPPPRLGIRLRIPARHNSAELEEPEEEKIPFGGVIEGADADTSKTTIIEADKLAFERSRRIAEDKLGGPPPGPTTTAGGGNWETPTTSGHGLPSPSSTPGPSRSGSMAHLTPNGRATPQPPAPQHSLSRSLRDRLFTQALPATPDSPASPAMILSVATGSGPSQKINKIRFGTFDIDTWYSAPYPEEYQYVPEGRLWLCEFCLKFMKSGFVAGRHRMKCKARHPPGDEIYRDGNVSVFEVDGRKNKIYCQNLCLLAKMFLDHKTLYYDVEPFLFYVMSEVDDLGARFVGYFSKEKRSPDNNVSCIMTLPVRQRKGWGQLLIDFSYLLSKKEGRVGSPEKPLSGLGAVTYKKYWQLSVFAYLRDTTGPVTLDEISAATSMTLLDVYTTLRDADLIRVQAVVVPVRRPIVSRGRARHGRGRGAGRQSLLRNSTSQTDIDDAESLPPSSSHPPPDDAEIKVPDLGRYEIVFDRDYLDAVLQKHAAKGHLELRPERLKYHPFLVSRNLPSKVGGNTLEVAAAALDETPDEDSSKTAVNDDGGLAEDGKEGEDNGELAKVIHGEDPETLALVAALSHEEPPKRSLRNRTSLSEEKSMADGLTPAVKRVRRSTRPSPAVPVARRGRSSGMIGVPVSGSGGGDGIIVIDGDEEEAVAVVPRDVDDVIVIDDQEEEEEEEVEEVEVVEAVEEVEMGPAVVDAVAPALPEEAMEEEEEEEEAVETVEAVDEVEVAPSVVEAGADVVMEEVERDGDDNGAKASSAAVVLPEVPEVSEVLELGLQDGSEEVAPALAIEQVPIQAPEIKDGAEEDEDAEGEEDEDAEGEEDEEYVE